MRRRTTLILSRRKDYTVLLQSLAFLVLYYPTALLATEPGEGEASGPCQQIEKAVLADPSQAGSYLLLERCLLTGLNTERLQKQFTSHQDKAAHAKPGTPEDILFWADAPALYGRIEDKHPELKAELYAATGRYLLEAELWANRRPAEEMPDSGYTAQEPILAPDLSGGLILAERYLKQALALDPASATAHAYLARLYFHKALFAPLFFLARNRNDEVLRLRLQHEMLREGISHAETSLRLDAVAVQTLPVQTQGTESWDVPLLDLLLDAYDWERKMARQDLDPYLLSAREQGALRAARLMGILRTAKDLKGAAEYYLEQAQDDAALITVYPPLTRPELPEALQSSLDTRKYPDDKPETHALRALLGQWGGHYLWAAEEYAKAYELDPANLRMLFAQGLMYEASGVLGKAEAIYKQLAATQETDTVAVADLLAQARDKLSQMRHAGKRDFLESLLKLQEGQKVAIFGERDFLLGLWGTRQAGDLQMLVGLQTFENDQSANAYLDPSENPSAQLDAPFANLDDLYSQYSEDNERQQDLFIVNLEGPANVAFEGLAQQLYRLKPEGTVCFLVPAESDYTAERLENHATAIGLVPAGSEQGQEVIHHAGMWLPGHYFARAHTHTEPETYSFASDRRDALYLTLPLRLYRYRVARPN